MWGLLVCWPLHSGARWTFLLMNVAVALGFVLVGATVLEQDGHRGTGTAMLAAGMLWPLNWVNEWNTGPWPLVAALQGPLASLLAVWAMLRYPHPLPRRQERAVTIFLTAFQVCSMLVVLTSRPTWHDLPPTTIWLTAWPDWTAFRLLTAVTSAGGAAVALTAAAALTVRVHRMPVLDRSVMRPVVSAIWLAAALTALSDLALLQSPDEAFQNLLYLVQEAALLAIPVAYLAAALRRRTLGASLPDLVGALEAAPDPAAIQAVLRRHLDDADLRVLFPVDDEHVDVDGHPVDPATLDGHQAETGPGRVALLLGRENFDGHAPYVRAVAEALALVLQNDALSVLIGVRIAYAARSSERIQEAIEAERDRFAHVVDTRVMTRLDEVHRLLVAVEAESGTPFRSALDPLREQLEDAAITMKALVEGRPGALLRKEGLAAALTLTAHDLAERIRVDATPLALPEEVAADLLLVGSELIVNAVKHAGPATIGVQLRRQGADVILDVTDDGAGGADCTGDGLAGLERRLAARGGTLSVTSPRAGGTRATARLPAPVVGAQKGTPVHEAGRPAPLGCYSPEAGRVPSDRSAGVS